MNSPFEDVYLGTGNVLGNARSGTLIVELSTISAETSRQLHRSAQQFDLAMLDQGGSGSIGAVDAGAVTLFGGGEHPVFGAAALLFSLTTRQWFYMGPGSSGVAMKLVVNTLLGVGMQAIGEAVDA
jgi:3-hydroxyisobutyrate dehydrogenase